MRSISASEVDSIRKYTKELEESNFRYKDRIAYLEKELNAMRNSGQFLRSEEAEPQKGGYTPAIRLENTSTFENLQNKIKEVEYSHKQDVLEYKAKVKTMEFALQNRKTEVDVLNNQIKKVEQELETTRGRIQAYERGLLDRASPLGLELRAAKERINILEKELDLENRMHSLEMKELKQISSKNESDFLQAHEALETYKTRNKELLDRVVNLEKQMDIMKHVARSKTPLAPTRPDKLPPSIKSRGRSALRGSSFVQRNSDDSDLNDRIDTKNSTLEDSAYDTEAKEDNGKRNIEIKTLRKERDLYKAQKEALEEKLERLIQEGTALSNMPLLQENLENKKKNEVIQNLRRDLRKAKTQTNTQQNIVADLEEELRNIEANHLDDKYEIKEESYARLRQKVMEMRLKVGEIEAENLVLRGEKAEVERKALQLEKELEEQSYRVQYEFETLVNYNSALQNDGVNEKKKFVEYLENMNKLHVERQEDRVGTKNDLQEEVNKLRRLLFEKENEAKLIVTQHDNDIKRFQSELEVAKEFGNSHLREVENIKWENERLNDEGRRLNDWKAKATEDLLVKDSQLDEAYTIINKIQKVLRKVKDEGGTVKDIDTILQESSNITGKEVEDKYTDPKDSKGAMSKAEFIRSWEEHNHKEQIKPQLLAKLVKQKDLLEAFMQDKPRLLGYLQEALTDESPEMYEASIKVMACLIDNGKISAKEKIHPRYPFVALMALSPARKNEPLDSVVERHYAGLVVLGFFADNGFIWDEAIVQLGKVFNAIITLLVYMRNADGKRLWQKRKAIRILRNMVDTTDHEIIPALMTGEGLNLIMENLEDSDPFVKRNISEMLSILTILQEVQTRFEKENMIDPIIKKLTEGDSKDVEFYLLTSILNVSSSQVIQEALYRQKMTDFFIKAATDDKYANNIQTIYRILINMSRITDNKVALYEKAFSILSRDISSNNKTTRKLALAFLALMVKQSSKYEKDVIMFPSLVQNIDHEDIEIQLLAVQLVFVLCARFQDPLIKILINERGIDRAVSLYCSASDPNIFHITGNLMLLLVSGPTKYAEELLMNGGYPMIRRLFKDLEHSDSQALYRAASILHMLSAEPNFIQSLRDPVEKIFSLKNYLSALLQASKVDEELIQFGLAILKAVTIPETVPAFKKYQVIELLLGFLVRRVFSVHTLLDVLKCLNILLVAGRSQGVVQDFASENKARGFEVLCSVVMPPLKKNVSSALAQSSVEIWNNIATGLDARVLDENYKDEISNMLGNIVRETDMAELRKALEVICQRLR